MSTPHEYQLTIIDSDGLSRRLLTELAFAFYRARTLWPEFKRNPADVTRRIARECLQALRRFLSTPNRLMASLAALVIVSAAVVTVLLAGNSTRSHPAADGESVELVRMLKFETEASKAGESGIGMNSNGRVGFNNGKRGGSNPQPSKTGGGGSGGMHDLTNAQQGRIPVPSAIPAPIPKLSSTQPTLPDAGIDIDPALWKALPFRTYGDPQSHATTPSNGPGEGGGMGNSTGTGIGPGTGPGVGPGKGGNIGDGSKSIGCCGDGGSDGDHISKIPVVLSNNKATEKARVVSKPEPQYTEDARKNQVTGTVVLRVVFSSSGQVTDIKTVSPLPYGLTERAIAAARQIKFSPARLNGQPVSVYFQLEYNFNLY